MENPFVLNKEDYKRDIDPINHYIQQATEYLSRSTGKDPGICEKYIKDQLRPGGQFEFKDPIIKHTERFDYKDRIESETTVLRYINDSIKKDELIAPTLTTYVNPKEKESLLVSFIDENVKIRGIAKKKMFEAGMNEIKAKRSFERLKEQGKVEDSLQFLEEAKIQSKEQKIQKSVQANKKTSNNSLSGAHVSASQPLFNRTTHSTLTSTCRTTAAYGNANNEKFVAGNRHYHSFDVTLNNLVSIVSNSNYNSIQYAMDNFDIRAPSIQETMDCIKYSAKIYWREEARYKQLEDYVSKLNGLERAAIVYTGDFYHLRKFNDSFVRTFLKKISSKVTDYHPDPIKVLKSTREDIHHLASQICDTEMKGVKINDAFAYKKDDDDNFILDNTGNKILADPHRAGIMASTINNIQNTLMEYSPVISAFWVTKNMPASVSYLPSCIRRVALVSDTDSTIFTVQNWIQWYFGEIKFTEESLGLCATVVFLSSQTITHILAMMSANFGVSTERIHQIAMKNEFRFDVFIPTQIAKHYYAIIGCQEGNLYDKYKEEIKGVHLKSSNAPKQIIDLAHKLMRETIMQSIVDGKKISIDQILSEVGNIERQVITSIKSGNYDYLRLAQIKEAESYTLEEHQSPYQHYNLWQEVFAPKYGHVPPPPYAAIKISTQLNSKRKMNDWIASLEDRELATRMTEWLIKNDKKNGMGTFQLPDQILSSSGFPEEVLSALDMRRIILDATGVFYIILETLGIYILNKKTTKLVSDYY